MDHESVLIDVKNTFEYKSCRHLINICYDGDPKILISFLKLNILFQKFIMTVK